MEFVINDSDKISIITPFYNVEDYLEESLNSILDQTYPNWELMLINDQSEDKSNQIAQEYCLKDSRINLHQNTSKGLISALRLAFQNSSGNYITRMDADDIMTSNRLDLMLKRIQEFGTGYVCVGKVKYFSENELGDGYKKYESWLNELTERESNFEGIYRECSIPSPNFLIHRNDFEVIGGFDKDIYPEDYDLAFRMYQNGLKICSTSEVTHHWRDHSTRSTRTQDHYQPLSFIPLKVRYFLDIDHNSNKQLILWGAGRKGKLIAKELLDQKIEFQWVTENDKKINKDIYGIVLSNWNSLDFDETQVIIGVSNEDEIKEIQEKLTESNNSDYFQFF